MTLAETMTLFQDQVSNMDSLWAYYSSAALAVLGFTIASDKATRSRHETIVIQAGFLLFAIGNAIAIYATQLTLIKLGVIVSSFKDGCGLANTFDERLVMLFHGVVTLAILVLIEVAFRYNKSSKKDAVPCAFS